MCSGAVRGSKSSGYSSKRRATPSKAVASKSASQRRREVVLGRRVPKDLGQVLGDALPGGFYLDGGDAGRRDSVAEERQLQPEEAARWGQHHAVADGLAGVSRGRHFRAALGPDGDGPRPLATAGGISCEHVVRGQSAQFDGAARRHVAKEEHAMPRRARTPPRRARLEGLTGRARSYLRRPRLSAAAAMVGRPLREGTTPRLP